MSRSTVIHAVFRLIGLIAILAASTTSGAAEYLSDDKILEATTTDLAAETTLFKTLQQGIALSLAACNPGASCQPSVNRDELEGMIASLNIRIGNLSQRFEENSEKELADILVSYSEIRDACNGYLEKLAQYTGESGGVDEEDELGEDEFDIFQDTDDEL